MRQLMLKILRWLMVMPVMGIMIPSAIGYAAIQVPSGYKAEVFASGIQGVISAKVNSNDELFVIEAIKNRILKITPDGMVSIFAKSAPGTPLTFWSMYSNKQWNMYPSRMDFHSNGDLYVEVAGGYNDPYNPYGDVLDTLYRITPDGTVYKIARQFLSHPFYDIMGLAFGPDGYLYMGDDWTPHDILKVDVTTKTSTKFATGVYSPYDLLFDKQGNLYACMSYGYWGNQRIYRYSPDGTRTLYLDAILAPIAMAWGPEGNLYVLDWATKAIYAVDPVTKSITTFATGFYYPYDIEFDSKGNLYVVEPCMNLNASTCSGQVVKISKEIIPDFTDVRLIDTIPTKDVEFILTSATKPPYSVATQGDTTVIEWRFDSFNIAQNETISFDLNLYNLIPGENRLVDHKLELIYTDKNGNEIRLELPPIYVAVLNSAFSSAVSIDRTEYNANEDVIINSNITNLSGYARTIDAKVVIEDSQGNLVKEVSTFTNVTFTAGEIKSFNNLVFNTATHYAGDYRAHLTLFENQQQIGETFANFKILPSKQAVSAIVSDKIAYSSNEPVTLTSTITSQSQNSILTGLEATVEVTDSNGTSIFSETRTLSDLMPEAKIEFKSFANTGTYSAGVYTASLTVRSNGESLSGAATSFEILSSLSQANALAGAISANPGTIFEKELTTLSYTIQNIGNDIDLPLIQIEILVVDPDTEILVRNITGETSLNGREVYANDITFDSTGLSPKPYLIVLRTTTVGVTQTLSSAGLIINPIPNNAPIANAGPDQIGFVGQSILFDGSASTDPDGDPLAFIWHFTSIPTNSQTTDASLSNSMTPTPSFVPDTDGIYTLSLVVNDGLADSQTDTVSVFVNPPPKVDIHPETINLKSNGGSKSITGILTSPVLSSFEFFTAEDGITITANFSLENRYIDKDGNEVIFTIPAEDYSGDDMVIPVDEDGDGDIDLYQLTLKFNRDQLIAGFKDAGGILRISQPTELTSTIIGSYLRVGSDMNMVISPAEVSKGGE